MFLRYFVSEPSADVVQNFTEVVPMEPIPPGLNARGVVKYSDVGHVEGCISHFRPCRVILALGPQFRETVYIFEVHGATGVKSDAQNSENSPTLV